jgi:hypothetical protein|tara:strand:- start:1988 stop:2473 length:486 start_codon:yes stop_codon:yes gene_type:complete
MFFEIDFLLFPIVIIRFNNEDIDDQEFDFFLKSWENIYKHQKNFVFIFDMINMPIYSVKYCFKMSYFIKKIRDIPIQYLKKSIMIVSNDNLCKMLKFIFYLQPPVSEVYITKSKLEEVIRYLQKNNNIYDPHIVEKLNINDIEIETHIKPDKPDKPFLPFL